MFNFGLFRSDGMFCICILCLTTVHTPHWIILFFHVRQLHLNYLKAEESQAKLDIRKKLEGYVHQYLCVVPQERKFCNPLAGDVIAESARWMPDFSAVRAAQAFTAIETYASNVINQPWRVEFREIKVTCEIRQIGVICFYCLLMIMMRVLLHLTLTVTDNILVW